VILFNRCVLLSSIFLCFTSSLMPMEKTADFVQVYNPVLEIPFSAAPGDFDEDGHIDIAVSNEAVNKPFITVLLGDGLGSFPLVAHFPITGSRSQDVVVDDFNHDDHLDICSINQLSEDISLLTGDGQGHFTETGVFATERFPEYAISGDFDENGYPDLAISHWVTGQMSVMLNDCQGGFLPPEIYEMYGGGTKEIDVGDFNEDNHIDLAIATMTFNFVLILFGDGSGSFDDLDSVYTDYDAYSVKVADFTHDEHDDIAVGTKHSFLLLKGDGEGNFERTFDVGAADIHAICARDFNEDGNTDAVLSMTQNNTYKVYLGDGEGGFKDHVVSDFLHSSPRSLDAADFNEDGHVDMVSANESSDDICLLINQVGLIELTAEKTRSLYAAGDKATFTFSVSNPQDTTVNCTVLYSIKRGPGEMLVNPALLNGQENPWLVTLPPGFEGEYSVSMSIVENMEPDLYQFYVNIGHPVDGIVWSSISYPIRVIERFSQGHSQQMKP